MLDQICIQISLNVIKGFCSLFLREKSQKFLFFQALSKIPNPLFLLSSCNWFVLAKTLPHLGKLDKSQVAQEGLKFPSYQNLSPYR